jgi:hypothetical protein
MQVVQADSLEPHALGEPMEVAAEDVGVRGPAIPAVEHEVQVDPSLPQRQVSGAL